MFASGGAEPRFPNMESEARVARGADLSPRNGASELGLAWLPGDVTPRGRLCPGLSCGRLCLVWGVICELALSPDPELNDVPTFETRALAQG